MYRPCKVDTCNYPPTYIRSKTFCLQLKIFHHFSPLSSFRITRIIFNFSSCSQLSSRLKPLIKYRFKTCSCSINCCRITSRTTANNNTLKMFNRLIHSCNFTIKVKGKNNESISKSTYKHLLYNNATNSCQEQ